MHKGGPLLHRNQQLILVHQFFDDPLASRIPLIVYHFLLLYLPSLYLIHIRRLCNMIVGDRQCRMNLMHSNGTILGTLFLAPHIKPIGCKWIYNVKLKSNGSLDRFKARLVALGNQREYGVIMRRHLLQLQR